MNVGFDAKRAFVNKTGLGNYSRSLISGLLQLFPDNNYFLFTPEVSDFYSPGPQANVVTPKGFFSKKFDAYWRTVGLRSQMKASKINVFHGLSSELPLSIKSAKVKKVVTVHDLIFLRFPQLYKKHDRLIYKKKTSFACGIADKVIAISQQTKDDLINYLQVPESKIEVLYQDCHPQFQIQTPDQKLRDVKKKFNLPDQFILIVGTVEGRKNHLNLLKALKLLPEDYHLFIVGKGTDYIRVLKNFVENNNLHNQVRFLEYVSFSDLPALYKLATVFAYPSFFEGFGIPILEALNAGTPVVTSTGSCFSETGGDSAIYASPDSPAEIADALKSVYQSETLRVEMVKKGYIHAQKFRKENNLPKLVQLYSSLL